ncbi:decaprenyl-phosphate phosphoribosyltransferase [Bifidobacterium sp. ESL0763]|uniref:decaprenyl-phosphate phosphoribosyltransferase n=1 Tax=Bifidobacterium sp. ESL0763 TaxID=2983227 RepID=UPI0023F8176D|nr:decaprenyl-phosphate phosphoribosyltransferase [Bifidobacterium sp. ESL0763]MDF7663239.1 decaprenyl-phosphate phosphoribosyltransferase [Bifidobacterium sp. ESL0763]
MKYLKLMRVRHYVKNVLIFAALLCSGNFFHVHELTADLIGFVSFCLISSVVYIINDIRDRDKDRAHPTKCHRPIASGAVSVRSAWVLAGVLFILSMAINAAVFHVVSTVVILLYLALNLAYSFGLKNVPLLDVAILVSGFLIRVVYGAVISDIDVSNWLYLAVTTLAFYFAFGKRRNELQRSLDSDQKKRGETRAVLKHYTAHFLDSSMNMCMTLAIAFYSLWSIEASHPPLSRSKYLVFTVPLVLLIVMKYNLTIEGDSDGDPVEVLVHDKVLMALCVLYAVVMFALLYL